MGVGVYLERKEHTAYPPVRCPVMLTDKATGRLQALLACLLIPIVLYDPRVIAVIVSATIAWPEIGPDTQASHMLRHMGHQQSRGPDFHQGCAAAGEQLDDI